MAGSGGLWIALSGFWLLVTSFRLGEFVPKRWRPARELTVFDPDGTKLRSVESHTGDSIYLALARNGLQLPSNCGGGQSCGLCEVRVRGVAPVPTSSDREPDRKSTTSQLQSLIRNSYAILLLKKKKNSTNH